MSGANHHRPKDNGMEEPGRKAAGKKQTSARTHPLIALLFLSVIAQAGDDRYEGPIVLSIRPSIDIPLWIDRNLFRTSEGAQVRMAKGFYQWPILEAGVGIGFHLGKLEHASLGKLGSLSIFNGDIDIGVRPCFGDVLNVYAGGSFGYFGAIYNDNASSNGTGLVWSGRVGTGLQIAPKLALSLIGEYRHYLSLYRLLGIGVELEMKFGGKK